MGNQVTKSLPELYVSNELPFKTLLLQLNQNVSINQRIIDKRDDKNNKIKPNTLKPQQQLISHDTITTLAAKNGDLHKLATFLILGGNPTYSTIQSKNAYLWALTKMYDLCGLYLYNTCFELRSLQYLPQSILICTKKQLYFMLWFLIMNHNSYKKPPMIDLTPKKQSTKSPTGLSMIVDNDSTFNDNNNNNTTTNNNNHLDLEAIFSTLSPHSSEVYALRRLKAASEHITYTQSINAHQLSNNTLTTTTNTATTTTHATIPNTHTILQGTINDETTGKNYPNDLDIMTRPTSTNHTAHDNINQYTTQHQNMTPTNPPPETISTQHLFILQSYLNALQHCTNSFQRTPLEFASIGLHSFVHTLKLKSFPPITQTFPSITQFTDRYPLINRDNIDTTSSHDGNTLVWRLPIYWNALYFYIEHLYTTQSITTAPSPSSPGFSPLPQTPTLQSLSSQLVTKRNNSSRVSTQDGIDNNDCSIMSLDDFGLDSHVPIKQNEDQSTKLTPNDPHNQLHKYGINNNLLDELHLPSPILISHAFINTRMCAQHGLSGIDQSNNDDKTNNPINTQPPQQTTFEHSPHNTKHFIKCTCFINKAQLPHNQDKNSNTIAQSNDNCYFFPPPLSIPQMPINKLSLLSPLHPINQCAYQTDNHHNLPLFTTNHHLRHNNDNVPFNNSSMVFNNDDTICELNTLSALLYQQSVAFAQSAGIHNDILLVTNAPTKMNPPQPPDNIIQTQLKNDSNQKHTNTTFDSNLYQPINTSDYIEFLCDYMGQKPSNLSQYSLTQEIVPKIKTKKRPTFLAQQQQQYQQKQSLQNNSNHNDISSPLFSPSYNINDTSHNNPSSPTAPKKHSIPPNKIITKSCFVALSLDGDSFVLHDGDRDDQAYIQDLTTMNYNHNTSSNSDNENSNQFFTTFRYFSHEHVLPDLDSTQLTYSNYGHETSLTYGFIPDNTTSSNDTGESNNTTNGSIDINNSTNVVIDSQLINNDINPNKCSDIIPLQNELFSPVSPNVIIDPPCPQPHTKSFPQYTLAKTLSNIPTPPTFIAYPHFYTNPYQSYLSHIMKIIPFSPLTTILYHPSLFGLLANINTPFQYGPYALHSVFEMSPPKRYNVSTTKNNTNNTNNNNNNNNNDNSPSIINNGIDCNNNITPYIQPKIESFHEINLFNQLQQVYYQQLLSIHGSLGTTVTNNDIGEITLTTPFYHHTSQSRSSKKYSNNSNPENDIRPKNQTPTPSINTPTTTTVSTITIPLKNPSIIYLVTSLHRILQYKYPHMMLLYEWYQLTTQMANFLPLLTQYRINAWLLNSEIPFLLDIKNNLTSKLQQYKDVFFQGERNKYNHGVRSNNHNSNVVPLHDAVTVSSAINTNSNSNNNCAGDIFEENEQSNQDIFTLDESMINIDDLLAEDDDSDDTCNNNSSINNSDDQLTPVRSSNRLTSPQDVLSHDEFHLNDFFSSPQSTFRQIDVTLNVTNLGNVTNDSTIISHQQYNHTTDPQALLKSNIRYLEEYITSLDTYINDRTTTLSSFIHYENHTTTILPSLIGNIAPLFGFDMTLFQIPNDSNCTLDELTSIPNPNRPIKYSNSLNFDPFSTMPGGAKQPVNTSNQQTQNSTNNGLKPPNMPQNVPLVITPQWCEAVLTNKFIQRGEESQMVLTSWRHVRDLTVEQIESHKMMTGLGSSPFSEINDNNTSTMQQDNTMSNQHITNYYKDQFEQYSQFHPKLQKTLFDCFLSHVITTINRFITKLSKLIEDIQEYLSNPTAYVKKYSPSDNNQPQQQQQQQQPHIPPSPYFFAHLPHLIPPENDDLHVSIDILHNLLQQSLNLRKWLVLQQPYDQALSQQPDFSDEKLKQYNISIGDGINMVQWHYNLFKRGDFLPSEHLDRIFNTISDITCPLSDQSESCSEDHDVPGSVYHSTHSNSNTIVNNGNSSPGLVSHLIKRRNARKNYAKSSLHKKTEMNQQQIIVVSNTSLLNENKSNRNHTRQNKNGNDHNDNNNTNDLMDSNASLSTDQSNLTTSVSNLLDSGSFLMNSTSSLDDLPSGLNPEIRKSISFMTTTTGYQLKKIPPQQLEQIAPDVLSQYLRAEHERLQLYRSKYIDVTFTSLHSNPNSLLYNIKVDSTHFPFQFKKIFILYYIFPHKIIHYLLTLYGSIDNILSSFDAYWNDQNITNITNNHTNYNSSNGGNNVYSNHQPNNSMSSHTNSDSLLIHQLHPKTGYLVNIDKAYNYHNNINPISHGTKPDMIFNPVVIDDNSNLKDKKKKNDKKDKKDKNEEVNNNKDQHQQSKFMLSTYQTESEDGDYLIPCNQRPDINNPYLPTYYVCGEVEQSRCLIQAGLQLARVDSEGGLNNPNNTTLIGQKPSLMSPDVTTPHTPTTPGGNTWTNNNANNNNNNNSANTPISRSSSQHPDIPPQSPTIGNNSIAGKPIEGLSSPTTTAAAPQPKKRGFFSSFFNKEPKAPPPQQQQQQSAQNPTSQSTTLLSPGLISPTSNGTPTVNSPSFVYVNSPNSYHSRDSSNDNNNQNNNNSSAHNINMSRISINNSNATAQVQPDNTFALFQPITFPSLSTASNTVSNRINSNNDIHPLSNTSLNEHSTNKASHHNTTQTTPTQKPIIYTPTSSLIRPIYRFNDEPCLVSNNSSSKNGNIENNGGRTTITPTFHFGLAPTCFIPHPDIVSDPFSNDSSGFGAMMMGDDSMINGTEDDEVFATVIDGVSVLLSQQ